MVFGSGFTTITNISKILSNVITVSPSENSYKIERYRDRDFIVTLSRDRVYMNIIWTPIIFFPPHFYHRSITRWTCHPSLHCKIKPAFHDIFSIFEQSKWYIIRLNRSNFNEEWSFFSFFFFLTRFRTQPVERKRCSRCSNRSSVECSQSRVYLRIIPIRRCRSLVLGSIAISRRGFPRRIPRVSTVARREIRANSLRTIV